MEEQQNTAHAASASDNEVVAVICCLVYMLLGMSVLLGEGARFSSDVATSLKIERQFKLVTTYKCLIIYKRRLNMTQ